MERLFTITLKNIRKARAQGLSEWQHHRVDNMLQGMSMFAKQIINDPDYELVINFSVPTPKQFTLEVYAGDPQLRIYFEMALGAPLEKVHDMTDLIRKLEKESCEYNSVD